MVIQMSYGIPSAAQVSQMTDSAAQSRSQQAAMQSYMAGQTVNQPTTPV